MTALSFILFKLKKLAFTRLKAPQRMGIKLAAFTGKTQPQVLTPCYLTIKERPFLLPSAATALTSTWPSTATGE